MDEAVGQSDMTGSVPLSAAISALEKRMAPESGAEYGLMSDDSRRAVRTANRIVSDCIETLLALAPERTAGSGVAEPDHLRFRRQAFERAMTIDPASLAGDLAEVDCSTVEGMARTLAVVSGGYGWTLSDDGRLAACVAGDQGYATTGIVVEGAE